MSTRSPKISIIVPVYKAEKYLHRCVDSILAQTFSDFEVLLIDDGSPDNSGKICDEYAKQDVRVKVIHKENGGVSSARQYGLDNAQGEYTIHADPDDWVESNMLEDLCNKAIEDDADMVICDFYYNTKTKQIYQRQKPTALSHETVVKELFQQLHGSCCNKLVKRTCYKDVRFDQTLSLYEDLFFHACLLRKPIKISYVPKAYYHYDLVINDTSICKNYSYKSYLYDVMVYNKFCNTFKETEAYPYVMSHMGFQLVYRAFIGNIFNSNEFRKACRQYMHCVQKRLRKTYYFRWVLVLSCMGGYRIAYNIDKWIKEYLKK